VETKPIKGTIRRDPDPARDAALAEALRSSEKDRAENLMIVDMVRNDLGRIARPGSVAVERALEIERYPTVWQMTSTVAAASDARLPELFAALFPCASVTGAPKPATTRFIRDLEAGARGVYCGAIGAVAPVSPSPSARSRSTAATRPSATASAAASPGTRIRARSGASAWPRRGCSTERGPTSS
jgi:anthranilate/para-aminobenzoate synthase component I